MYLNFHSFFSLTYGVMPIKELLAYAKENDITTFALTDINNTSGCLELLREAPKYDIKPSIGVDFRNDDEKLFIAIARNNNGFRELNDYLTIYKKNKKDIPAEAPEFRDCYVIYRWQKDVQRTLKDHEYISLHPSDITAYRLYGKYPASKLVIDAPVSFRTKKDFNLHRLLRAIYYNTLLSKLGKHQQGKVTDKIIPAEELELIYEDFPDAISNTQRILDSSLVEFDFTPTNSKNKKRFNNTVEEDINQLWALAKEGLAKRYGDHPEPDIIARFESEMKTIIELGFVSYFLINWDIVRYARERKFYYIGRGSGANSIVAYCLLITDVDPMELNLYFERFINPARKAPPDFDIDFSHTDRDVIRDYIFDKYEGHVALVGSYSTFQRKSCIREIAKVFGLPDHEIDALQSERLDLNTLDRMGKMVLEYSDYFAKEHPRQLSVHACGIIISEEPITAYSTLEYFPVGYPSTQYSMIEAEDVGLHKFDILSQRGLGHIKDAVDLIRVNKGEEIDIHRIQDFKEDARIRQMLIKGDTLGCFYVESPAMRQLLRKLEVRDYLGLVAASSIIRPGVSHSGMMREFILRYRSEEERKKAHPKLFEIMPDTYGIMVYQEDVIKVASIYGHLTLAEADIIRRGMSGKYRSREEFQQVKQKFFDNCKEKEYPDEEVAEIWRQMESFAGYSFAKGHSASYAVESYQSLYLRAYYPIEFMTGVINNFGGYYNTEFYLHEAKMLGAQVELPCINHSDNLAVLSGIKIYMGFCLIKDLEHGTVASILKVRADGAFADMEDFVRRTPISLEQLRILIRIKAFRFTGKTSKQLLWDAHLLLGKSKKTAPKRELFAAKRESTALPELEYGEYEDALDEMKILSFPYTSPFTMLSKEYRGITDAKGLIEHLGKVVYMVGYYITIRRVHTITDQIMYFGNFYDKHGDMFDTVHFPDSIKRYPFTGRGCYLVKGTVVQDFGVPSVEVTHMTRIPWSFADEYILTG
jgi:DNA-directed DNA polymerase III PolC